MSIEGTNTQNTHYLDGFQYTQEVLDFFPHKEGYVKVVSAQGVGGSSSFNYVFSYTDHLGNIRLRYTKTETQGLTILEEDHYYPFGLKHNGYNSDHKIFEFNDGTNTVLLTPVTPSRKETYKYKFQGQEHQDEFGLNWDDYGARNYQADLGRFFNMDRYAESFMPISTYQYAANNPISYIDYNGDYITIGIQDDDGNQVYSVLYENGKAYHYTQDSKGNITKGDVYDGDSGGFVEQAVGDLNKIAGTKQGGHIVNQLQRSSSNYSISNSGDPLVNNFDPNNNSIKYSQANSGVHDGVSMNKSHIKLGHEIAHAYDKGRGFDMGSTLFNGELPASEINAVKFEDYLRAQDGETKMRTMYGPFNISGNLGGSSSNYFNNYIAPLGKYERHRTFYPPSTNEGVDKTRVYIRPATIRYDTRDKSFKSE